jgi:hypothetical protein
MTHGADPGQDKLKRMQQMEAKTSNHIISFKEKDYEYDQYLKPI